jgi:hypothetical protein
MDGSFALVVWCRKHEGGNFILKKNGTNRTTIYLMMDFTPLSVFPDETAHSLFRRKAHRQFDVGFPSSFLPVHQAR